LIELYEATFRVRHLARAIELVSEMERLFRDRKDGGYYFSGEDGETLLARAKEVYDGAQPSGNSVAALVLLRLSRMTGDGTYEARAESILRAFGGSLARVPAAHTQLLAALDFALGPTREIVISGARDAEDTRGLVSAVRERYLPRAVTMLRGGGAEGEQLARLAPFTAPQGQVGGRAAAYVCENFACAAPVTERAALEAFLR
jgi:uncharacterized protein YyaL (SSP411 family)